MVVALDVNKNRVHIDNSTGKLFLPLLRRRTDKKNG